MKRFLAFLTAGTTLLLSGCSWRGSFSSYLDDSVKEFFSEDYLGLHFTMKNPEAYGIAVPEATLGSFYAEENLFPDRALNYLKGYENDEMTEEEELCYEILEFYGGISASYPKSYLYYEPLDALKGVHLNLPVNLSEFRFDDEQDIEDYFKLLEDTSRFFENMLEYEEKRAEEGYFISKDELSQVIKQCRDFIAAPEENLLLKTFRGRLQRLGVSEDKIPEYEKRNETLVKECVIPAYEDLADRLEEEFYDKCVEASAICDYPDGKDYYSYLLISNIGTDKTPEEIEELAEDKLKSYIAEQKSLVKSDPSLPQMYRDFKFPDASPEETLDFFKDSMKDFYPAPASDVYRLEDIDKSLEESSSPAFYLIPPMDDKNANAIYLNRSERYKDESLYLTLAHEGYPGHLYQMTAFQNTSPHPLRWILSNLGYVEGWATAAEQWAWAQTGAPEDLIRFGQLQELVTLSVYTLADLYVNYDGLTAEEVHKKLAFAGISKELASKLSDFAKTYELHILPYYVGFLEMESILSEAKELSLGLATEKELYERYLSIGPAPFPAVRELMLFWAENTAGTDTAKLPA